MNSIRQAFRGVTTALVTPFGPAGDIDWNALEALLERQIAAGIQGILPCGSTGEAATLSHAEHVEIFRFVVDKVAGRVPVLAGTGSNNTAEAVELSIAAERAGADAVLLISPYYNKPTQAGLLQHYREVADNIGIPMILYDIPGRTQVKIELETTIRLAEHARIQGIKDATGSVHNTSLLRNNLPEDFGVFSGDDALTLPMMAVGADGVISVASHLVPEKLTAMVEACHNNDFAVARSLHQALLPLFEGLFVESNPVPVKYCLRQMGWITNDYVRPPLVSLRAESRDALDKLLQDGRLT